MSLRIFDSDAGRGFRHTTLADVPTSGTDGVVWVDATSATAAEIEAIGELYGFHALAIEDVRKRRQRPTVDVYGPHLFVVL